MVDEGNGSLDPPITDPDPHGRAFVFVIPLNGYLPGKLL